MASSERPVALPPAPETAAPRQFELVWADEFDRDGRPDSNKWTYERGFVRNEELQWYRPENARVEHGHLIIEARRERIRNPAFDSTIDDWRARRRYAAYTSASLTTRGLASWQYGRFEMRARIDVRPGMWPAFWTLGEQGFWPASGEIDVMEYYRGLLLANVAWADSAGERSGTPRAGRSCSSVAPRGRPTITCGGWTGTSARSGCTSIPCCSTPHPSTRLSTAPAARPTRCASLTISSSTSPSAGGTAENRPGRGSRGGSRSTMSVCTVPRRLEDLREDELKPATSRTARSDTRAPDLRLPRTRVAQ